MKRLLLSILLVLAVGTCTAKGFVVRKSLVKSEAYRELAAELDHSGLLQQMAVELNQVIVLDDTLGLRFSECGEPNAFYDPKRREVAVCYELIESYYENMAAAYDTEDELDDAVAGAFLFVFFHEVGHALVDVLDVPVTGREEDAVDQLSVWVLVDGEEGDKAVLDAAVGFYAAAEAEDAVDEGSFADEHSLDQQRFYNMICWVYGSDPDAYGNLVEDGHLPAERAERCAAEYARIDRSWSRLLAAHLKP